MPRSAGAETGLEAATEGSVSLSGGNASCSYLTLFCDKRSGTKSGTKPVRSSARNGDGTPIGPKTSGTMAPFRVLFYASPGWPGFPRNHRGTP
jgi:hypothetical protein